MLSGRERGAVLVQQIETHHLLTLLYTMMQAHISNIVSRTRLLSLGNSTDRRK